MMVTPEVAAAVAHFVEHGRTGSVTLHFKDGRLASWESREVGRPRPSVTTKER